MLRKILILGSKGMLGSYLLKEIEKKGNFEIFASSRSNIVYSCDFRDKQSVSKLLDKTNPDIVINCVGLTSIDFCESFSEVCSEVNSETPKLIAKWCDKSGSYFIHISTDHFFSDDGDKAHSESSSVKIVNSYAESKYKAEKYIKKVNKSALILRTSIIGITKDKRNFLDWSVNNLYENTKVGLFYNSFTSLIHGIQFSKVLIKLLDKKLSGVYNLASSEVFSKANFYIELAKALGIEPNHFGSDINNLVIKRANSCGLSIKKIEKDSGLVMPTLREVVEICVEEQRIKKL